MQWVFRYLKISVFTALTDFIVRKAYQGFLFNIPLFSQALSHLVRSFMRAFKAQVH
jgi:hypothetical protein